MVTADPFYADDLVTLYHADARKRGEWLAADVLVMDPPYGRDWQAGAGLKNAQGGGRGSRRHGGIVGDKDTTTRDTLLEQWGRDRLAIVFGDLLIPPPAGAVQVLIYAKPLDAGVKGARAGRRRDAEAIYLVGPWPAGVGGETSILRTGALVAGPRGLATRYGHPHAKPLDVMSELIAMTEGTVADPTAGGGSTLAAAKGLGRPSIGFEVEAKYCRLIAERLGQESLFVSEAPA